MNSFKLAGYNVYLIKLEVMDKLSIINFKVNL